MGDANALTVRINDVGKANFFNVDLSEGSTIESLKELIQEQHPDKPPVSKQRLVLYGKPLNDNGAMLATLLEKHSLDSDITPTIHLVIPQKPSTPASGSSPRSPPASSSLQHRRPPASGSDAPAASSSAPSPQPAQPAAAPASAHPQPAAQTHASSVPAKSGAAQRTLPMVAMHPILAAAYNAAYASVAECSPECPPPTFTPAVLPINVHPALYGAPAYGSAPLMYASAPMQPTVRHVVQGVGAANTTRLAQLLAASPRTLDEVLRALNADGRGGAAAAVIGAAAGGGAGAARPANGAGPRPRTRVYHLNIRVNVRAIVQTLVLLVLTYLYQPFHRFLAVVVLVIFFAMQLHLKLFRWVNTIMETNRRAAAPAAPGGAPAAAGGGAQAPRPPSSRIVSAFRTLGCLLLSFVVSLFPQYNVEGELGEANAAAIAAAQRDMFDDDFAEAFGGPAGPDDDAAGAGPRHDAPRNAPAAADPGAAQWPAGAENAAQPAPAMAN